MLSTLILPLLLAADPTPGDVWPGFRGDGTSRTSAVDLPLRWSPNENVAWRVGLPGYGQSSPVVSKGRVFVTAVEGRDKATGLILALDAESGKVAWRHELATAQKGRNDPSMSRAAPTPVVDAAAVYAFFEGGNLIALSHDGKLRWERSLTADHGEFKNHHGLAASLVQTDAAVVVLVDHAGPSYLLAADKATGKTLWKSDRKSGMSWTSPVVTKVGGREVVLVSGNGSLIGYDAADGRELWTLGGLSGNLIPSPTAVGDLIVVGAGESGLTSDLKAAARSNCCVRMIDREGRPAVERVWEGKKVVLHHASPLVHHGHVYLTTRAGVLHCLDLKSGEERYSVRLAEPCWATPIAAGERVYFFGKDGVTTVIRSGEKFEELAVNRLWSGDDLAGRRDVARSRPENTFPPLPAAGKEAMETMLAEAVGDVVYGVAAIDGAFYVRTGTELIRVRRAR